MEDSGKEQQIDTFFDAPEEISSDSDSTSEDPDQDCISKHQQIGNPLTSFHYDFWVKSPRSVDERRDKFTRQTGFHVLERCLTAKEGPDDSNDKSVAATHDHVDQAQGALATDEMLIFSGRNQSLHERVEFNVDENEIPITLDHESSVDTTVSLEDLESTSESSNRSRYLAEEETDEPNELIPKKDPECKESWLKRFSFKAANMLGNKKESSKKLLNSQKEFGFDSQRVRVHSHKKWSKSLSSLYRRQEFCAHNGPILTMKFSLDGKHLATGGEDGALNIWKVIEDDRSNDPELENSNDVSTTLRFAINGISNLASFLKVKQEGSIINRLKNPSDSACVMIPRKKFRLLERPLHEFLGHEDEILDISWSKKKHLLSSSVDKTVRLWRLGSSECLRVFPHNDYVTCTQFNPVDDKYFISGSIDGIVRIWEVIKCQVVNWIDIKEIVTAICYQPDGKGGIVGSMAGNCSFLDITGDRVQHHHMRLKGKKAITCKRITAIQFSPSNPTDVVVSSADSQVRILNGVDVICKLRGSLPLIDRKSQISASFSADGRHVISATEESHVYMWNHLDDGKFPNGKTKNIWSCESFLSPNALIAIPWHGITSLSEEPDSATRQHSRLRDDDIDRDSGQKSSLSRDSSSSYDKSSSVSSSGNSVTQLEEALIKSSTGDFSPGAGKIDYEFLRDVCESILSGDHLWGLVIVTAGKDGTIRTYQNYGLPVRYPRAKSLKLSNSFSAFRKRCKENCSKRGSSSFSDSFR